MESFDRLKSAPADRYSVERQIGAGGMADVYLTHDLRHNRKVAIKVMHHDLAEFVGVERCLREIETTAKLQHPHILPRLVRFGVEFDKGVVPSFTPIVRLSADGERFLLTKLPGDRPQPRIMVVLNWVEELRARVPR
jgi:serine/threonine-protein kinase